MIVEERRQRVLDSLAQRGFMALADLAQITQASESTIRRDLDYFEEKGLLRRTHGGAIFLSDKETLPPFEDRSGLRLDEKRATARLAASRIQDGDSVLLDGGTTTLEVARFLVGRPVQIVTNSLPIAHLFESNHATDLVMLGGYVFPRTGVALGPLTVRMMEELHVHQTILSVGGITAKGLFNSNLLLVETERAMMKCADEVVVVADHTKIGRQALAFLCKVSDVDTLIVDRGLSESQRALAEAQGVRLLVADETESREEFR